MTHSGIETKYRAILANADLTSSEKAGYLLAVSRVDPEIPELTLDEARNIVGVKVTP